MFLKLGEWILAARLKTIPLSICGVLIGSFSAYSNNSFNINIFIFALLTTISYQILSNFANDYGDGIKGTDLNRIGPKRAIQSGNISANEMKKGIVLCSILSLTLTTVLVLIAFKENIFNTILFLLIGMLAITSAIKYTVGKNAYGYYGMGDLFVLIFFGIVSVMGSNFLYTKSINPELIFPAFTIGLLSVGVLNLNNMRDVDNDKISGKNTVAVKLGFTRSKIYHYLLMSFSAIFIILFHMTLNSKSILLLVFSCLIVLLILIHCFQIYKVNTPKKFDPFLKTLVLKTFLYSILISLHFLKYL